jgi:hypothetical protein
MEKDILKTLAADHRELERLFNRLEATTERAKKTREKLFLELKQLLTAHSKAEEAVLYDRLAEESDEAREKTLEGYEEHHVASLLLKEMSLLPADHERWDAKLKVLKEAVSHHIEEEEDETFASARKLVPTAERGEMVAEFQTLKAAHFAGVGLPARVARKAMRKLAA